MVYILKFDRPIGGRANYYIGWCEDHRFNARMRHHERGTGARLTQVARERGIGWQVVVTIDGAGRDIERQFKNYKATSRLIKSLRKKGLA